MSWERATAYLEWRCFPRGRLSSNTRHLSLLIDSHHRGLVSHDWSLSGASVNHHVNIQWSLLLSKTSLLLIIRRQSILRIVLWRQTVSTELIIAIRGISLHRASGFIRSDSEYRLQQRRVVSNEKHKKRKRRSVFMTAYKYWELNAARVINIKSLQRGSDQPFMINRRKNKSEGS